MKMKPLPKFILIALLMTGGYFGIVTAFNQGWIPSPKTVPSSIPAPVTLPEAREIIPPTSAVPRSVSLPTPSTLKGQGKTSEIRFEIWAWNAQMGLLFANGGATTTTDSLMAKRGIKVRLTRQDDVPQMQNNLIKFAMELAEGAQHPTGGTHFIVIMGDGTAAFFAGINPQLAKLCPDCTAQIIGATGYSRGEDKLMGPPAWKNNPQTAQGGVIAGVLRDGDWNIALKWAGDNQICNNPDEKTYDPNCLNWINAENYIAAAELYVSSYCEERPVVASGKSMGKTAKICVQGVVTWTPGDVIIAKKRGGLVSVVSTKQYRWQMPAVIIGNKKWMQENRQTVEEMLAAIFEGGEAVKSDPNALLKAATISAEVYKEESPQYWMKYYKGITEPDMTGMPVELGGSTVNNLTDNLQLFGLLSGSDNLLSLVYSGFGNIVVQQYPALVPNYPPIDEVLDTSYVAAISQREGELPKPDLPSFNRYAPIKEVTSKRTWQVNFETGKDALTSEGEKTMIEIYDSAAMTGLAIEAHGHTDNTGNKMKNQSLSEARALTIKRWLEKKSSVNFPPERTKAIGHGSDYPIASNATEEGRAQNRRVEIVMGN